MIKHIIPLFLFFILTPGILWTYSKKTNKYLIGLLHAVVFAFVCHFIQSRTPIKEGLNEIKGLSFRLEKNMNNRDIKKKLKEIFIQAQNRYGDITKKNSYDNIEGQNVMEVITHSGSKETTIYKEDLMDPNFKNILKFIKETEKGEKK